MPIALPIENTMSTVGVGLSGQRAEVVEAETKGVDSIESRGEGQLVEQGEEARANSLDGVCQLLLYI